MLLSSLFVVACLRRCLARRLYFGFRSLAQLTLCLQPLAALFLCLDLFDQKVLVQELCQDFLRELAPELRHEVPRGQVLRRLQQWVNLGQRGHAKHVVVHDANLYRSNESVRPRSTKEK